MIGFPRQVTACAHANIALVKYWGKRDAELNLPAAGSLSLTLAELTTTTSVRFVPGAARDTLTLDGHPAPEPARARLASWLDLVRDRAGSDLHAEVSSVNDFPTASGLASSASAYAAVTVAACAAAGLDLDQRELSLLARRGSGSAARSIFGGFVIMHRGQRDDGGDAFAEALSTAESWPVRMIVAVVGGGAPKAHSSREAMEHCARTSPLHAAWLQTVPRDLAEAQDAVAASDLVALGEVAERSALTMHAAAMASRPPILYWRPETLTCMQTVRVLRAGGVPAYFTIDAGPHVKVLTLDEHAERVARTLREVDGVTEVVRCTPGGPAVVVEEPTS